MNQEKDLRQEEQDTSLPNEENTDPDIEEKETLKPGAGIQAEEYDSLPQNPENPELEEGFDQEEKIKIAYSFNGDELREGLTLYQRLTLFKRNCIYTIVLLGIILIYLYNVMNDPKNSTSYFFAILCVSVICMVWILPKIHIRNTVKAVTQNPMEFTMEISKKGIRIGDDGATYILGYQKDITKILETDRIYIICTLKHRLFILPKRHIQNDEEKIREIFNSALHENFFQSEKK